MKIIKNILPYIIVIVVVILIRTFIVTPVQVVGTSMVPTLEDGELMLLNKIKYSISDIKRFDIVVVNREDKLLIKRVIGMPGEKVEYKDDILYIDDKKVEEKFNKNSKTNDYKITETGYKTIPKGKYFVVGDNRNNSEDSRIIGLIDKKDILGKADFVLLPFSKFGAVK